jgi:dsDNA-specific endonuclease/ATPase MutS2
LSRTDAHPEDALQLQLSTSTRVPEETASDEPVPLPINGVLDLHTFRPAEVKDLVPEYLAECRARDILQVRIIHGKGTGTLRETVHAILRRSPIVRQFALGNETAGGWGATVVELLPK